MKPLNKTRIINKNKKALAALYHLVMLVGIGDKKGWDELSEEVKEKINKLPLSSKLSAPKTIQSRIHQTEKIIQSIEEAPHTTLYKKALLKTRVILTHFVIEQYLDGWIANQLANSFVPKNIKKTSRRPRVSSIDAKLHTLLCEFGNFEGKIKFAKENLAPFLIYTDLSTLNRWRNDTTHKKSLDPKITDASLHKILINALEYLDIYSPSKRGT